LGVDEIPVLDLALRRNHLVAEAMGGPRRPDGEMVRSGS
jgi:hypothetical protein